MKIKTNYWMKPIPQRFFDWEAYDDETLDIDSLIGYGATEGDAVADLKEKSL